MRSKKQDSNRDNCDLENLELISRHELALLNKKGYKETPEELKPTLRAVAKVDAKRFGLIKKVSNQ